MKATRWLAGTVATAVLALQMSAPAVARNLRVVTINVWSGFDYKGTLSFGRWETATAYEARFRALANGLRALDPDVVLLQEANPAGPYARRLARALGMDQVHLVCLGGIKVGPVGVPWGFREGLGTLARHGLRLKPVADWRLGGGKGVFGDALTMNFSDTHFAQVSEIEVDGYPVRIVNVHLLAAPPDNESTRALLDQSGLRGDVAVVRRDWERRLAGIEREVRILTAKLAAAEANAPMPLVVGGDFNTVPGSDAIRTFSLGSSVFDAQAAAGRGDQPTWDGTGNANAACSARGTDARGNPLAGFDLFHSLSDRGRRRIDYVFLGGGLRPSDLQDCQVVLNSPVHGVLPSDHYGVLADIDLDRVQAGGGRRADIPVRPPRPVLEGFPILSYDSNTGAGMGATVAVLDQLGHNELVNLILFGSSKGERWTRLQVSLPDREQRQSREYPLALDLNLEYDRWIRYSYFGTGPQARFEDEETYRKDWADVSLALSRALRRELVVQATIHGHRIGHWGLDPDGLLARDPVALSRGRVTYGSVEGNLRYDTRDSFIRPSRGVVLEAIGEWSPGAPLGNVRFGRVGGYVRSYTGVVSSPRTVLALRAGLEALRGDDLPVQVRLPIGGNRTVRGSALDRYVGRVAGLANAEIRFPLVWRFGGIAGLDAGRVWNRVRDVGLERWTWNPAVGLRFDMTTFLIRADVGFGQELTGIYLNFNHIY